MDEPEFSIIDRKQMNMGELASARLTKNDGRGYKGPFTKIEKAVPR